MSLVSFYVLKTLENLWFPDAYWGGGGGIERGQWHEMG